MTNSRKLVELASRAPKCVRAGCLGAVPLSYMSELSEGFKELEAEAFTNRCPQNETKAPRRRATSAVTWNGKTAEAVRDLVLIALELSLRCFRSRDKSKLVSTLCLACRQSRGSKVAPEVICKGEQGLAEGLVASVLSLFRGAPGKVAPHQLMEVLSDSAVLCCLIEIVQARPVPTELRRIASKVLVLSKTPGSVSSMLKHPDSGGQSLLQALNDLCCDLLKISDYPTMEHVIRFLVLFCKHLSSKSLGWSKAVKAMLASLSSSCPALARDFSSLVTSGEEGFYDRVRSCIYKNQVSLKGAWERKAAAASRGAEAAKWFGEGVPMSTMFRVSGVYLDCEWKRLQVPVGEVTFIDVNADSCSFWYYCTEEASAEDDANGQSYFSFPCPLRKAKQITLLPSHVKSLTYSSASSSCRLHFNKCSLKALGIDEIALSPSAIEDESPDLLASYISPSPRETDGASDKLRSILVVLERSDFADFRFALNAAMPSISEVHNEQDDTASMPLLCDSLSTRKIHEKYCFTDDTSSSREGEGQGNKNERGGLDTEDNDDGRSVEMEGERGSCCGFEAARLKDNDCVDDEAHEKRCQEGGNNNCDDILGFSPPQDVTCTGHDVFGRDTPHCEEVKNSKVSVPSSSFLQRGKRKPLANHSPSEKAKRQREAPGRVRCSGERISKGSFDEGSCFSAAAVAASAADDGRLSRVGKDSPAASTSKKSPYTISTLLALKMIYSDASARSLMMSQSPDVASFSSVALSLNSSFSRSLSSALQSLSDARSSFASMMEHARQLSEVAGDGGSEVLPTMRETSEEIEQALEMLKKTSEACKRHRSEVEREIVTKALLGRDGSGGGGGGGGPT